MGYVDCPRLADRDERISLETAFKLASIITALNYAQGGCA